MQKYDISMVSRVNFPASQNLMSPAPDNGRVPLSTPPGFPSLDAQTRPPKPRDPGIPASVKRSHKFQPTLLSIKYLGIRKQVHVFQHLVTLEKESHLGVRNRFKAAHGAQPLLHVRNLPTERRVFAFCRGYQEAQNSILEEKEVILDYLVCIASFHLGSGNTESLLSARDYSDQSL